MKAIVYTQYGAPEVLVLKEVAQPVPRENEVLIKVHATVAAPPDCQMRRGDTWVSRFILGLRKPRKTILGLDLAGVVEAVGKKVKQFKVGDSVYGFAGLNFGTYAEYICLPEKGLVLKPSKLSYAEAAAVVDGATTALYFIKEKAGLKPGQRILINGASGGMGVFAVQLARFFGAAVTGVCSTANLPLVQALGAHTVINYTQEDFTKRGETWDVIFDVSGKSSFAKCRASLTPNGLYLATVFSWKLILQMLWTRMVGGKKAIFALSLQEKSASLAFLNPLMEAGKLKTIIAQSFPLEQTALAHRRVEAGGVPGKVVITVQEA